MDSFIKKIFEDKVDENVHMQFSKFSRGEFKDRALISARKSAKKFSISTSYEYANDLVKSVAEKLSSNEKVKITGAIVSTRDLINEIQFKEKKQFQGVKRYILDTEMTKEQILNLCNNFPKAFIALSFEAKGTELKIKPKTPKSGKPRKGDEAPKADFCKIKTSDEEIVKSLLFDVKDFKKIDIQHDFIISEIEIPKNEKDPALMREKAVRRGKIVRKIKIDDKNFIEEKDFSA